MPTHQAIAPDQPVLLVGNPSPRSRTRAAAELLTASLAAGWDPRGPGPETIELADHIGSLLARGDTRLTAAAESVRSARLLVVATPVYKGSYTGLLKVFLDRLPHDALERAVVVPVVLAASSAHSAVADLHLRHVLGELGASLPVPSFRVQEQQLDHLLDLVDDWRERFAPTIAALLDVDRAREVLAR